MKPFFRWHTDEDDDWANDPASAAAPPAKRRFRLALLYLSIIVLGASIVYWRQIRQVRQEEAQIQADVLAAFYTWQQAVLNDDFDLFVRLVAPQAAEWQNGQRALFLQEALLDRLMLGLASQTAPENVAVELTPDWQMAELTFEQMYTAVPPLESTHLIRLQQTQLYQLEDSRWRLSSPNAEFWGEATPYDGQWLTLIYPARDGEWARRLAADLDAELAAICAEKRCASGVNVRLDTTPDSLADLKDLLTPVFNGRTHILPTFTLTGLPLDEDSYQALYQSYTRRIITVFQNNLELPLPLPQQAIQSLCFSDDSSIPQLFRYDLISDTWLAELPGRPFRFLSPLPDDSGLILADLPATNDASRLTLHLWQNNQETLLFDDTDPARQWRFPYIGWAGQSQLPHLVLHEFDTVSQTRTLYHWLNLNQCAATGCAITDLPGYTLWSPNGRSTLIVIGSDLWLGDENGASLQAVGRGLTPFWLDESTFGYTRYQPGWELVITSLTGNTQQVIDERGLTAVLTDPATGTPAINHIIPHPAIPGLLILTGSELRGAGSKYNIFTFQFDDWTQSASGTLTLRMQLDDSPLGYPSLLTPGGIPPVSFSPDGRWLAAAQLTDPPDDTWQIHLHDLSANQTQIISSSSPRYPANSPFFDWSNDGLWLVLVDDGFFKLIAPAANYERIILHDFDNCYFTAWVE